MFTQTFKKTEKYETTVKQYRLYMYNVILRNVFATIVLVEKNQVLNILRLYLQIQASSM